jgi:DNA-directed RNA polymerase subunit RPC12/RpoP
MIDDYSHDLLRNGIIEAKAGNKNTARRYLDRALYMSSDHDVMAESWFWISQITDDPVEKRKALENCLSNDLQHARARRLLAILDGRLKLDEVVDPDNLLPAPEGLRQSDSQRLMCPKCGGRMAFAPDGQSLVCEYCARSQTLESSPGTANEKDFLVAMATMRGHGKPLNEQVFHCQGCGAEFILPPGQLSVTCVYCGSPSVVKLEKSGDLLGPDAIIPYAFDQKHSIKLLVNWVNGGGLKPEKQVERPRGLYLPLWTFDLGGWIDYTGEVIEEGQLPYARQVPRMVHVSDRYPVMLNDVPIPASRKLSAPFIRLVPTFDLKAVKSYEPGYLAGWPAELYDVPMADASLDARSGAFARLKHDLPNLLSPLHLISTSSANMTIESFRLNLLPVWMTEIWLEARSYLVLINGQNGMVESDWAARDNKPANSLRDWLADLLKD